MRRHQLAKNTSWIVAGQGSNFVLQAGYFVLLARLLGVTEYGVFAGVFALVNIFAPYSALGAGVLFMRYVSRDHAEAPVYWGNALLTTCGMTVLIGAVLIIVGPLIAKTNNLSLIVQLVIANCLFSQIVLLASRVFQTFERMRYTAMLSLLSNLARFIVLLVMQFTMHRATAAQWSLGLLVSSAITALIAMRLVYSAVGPSTWDVGLIVRRTWEGLAFAMSATSQAIYNDLDKTLLSHYGLNRENGFYTLAYRIVDFAATPVGAIDVAVLPRFFKLSSGGMKPVIRLAAKSVGISVLLGIGIAASTWLLAPLVPHIVGHDFSGVLVALHWLCVIPLLRGIHTISGSALTTTGHQHTRVVVQLCVAALNLGLNVWWIPKYGWIGAAWSSVVSDGTLALVNTILVAVQWRWASQQELSTSPAA